MNDRYKEIGTSLIQAAVEKSILLGLDGKLRVEAYNNRGKESPFKFYLKMGFNFSDPKKSIAFYEQLHKKHVSLAKTHTVGEYLNLTDSEPTGLNLGLRPQYEKMKMIKTDEDYQNSFEEFLSGFQEPMFLNTDALERIWLPKILENSILPKPHK